LQGQKSSELTITSQHGCTVGNARLHRLLMEETLNIARTEESPVHTTFTLTEDAEGSPPPRPVARLFVWQRFGPLGDVRKQPQVVYGIDEVLSRKLHLPATDLTRCFDGQRRTGTVLWPAETTRYRGGHASASVDKVLRSAQIILQYERPVTASALAIWEDPRDLPTAAFVLECADTFQSKGQPRFSSRTWTDNDWTFLCGDRGNTAYFHVHKFPPTSAKVWRYTIVDTPGKTQRLAELELLQFPADVVETEVLD
jgi:hypothetical protein